MAEIERVAATRRVEIEALIVSEQIVALVVDALEGQVGPRWLPSAVWL
jgi:hypothetical protein